MSPNAAHYVDALILG